MGGDGGRPLVEMVMVVVVVVIGGRRAVSTLPGL